MRSDLVFAASDRVKNRFLLCRIVSISARRLHKGTVSIQESLNGIFELLRPDNAGMAVIAPEDGAAIINGKEEDQPFAPVT